MSSSIDKTKFGTGFQPEGEGKDRFVFIGQNFDQKDGAGGAVPVRDYDGPWPVFGKPEDSWEQQGDVGWTTEEIPSDPSSSSSSPESSSSESSESSSSSSSLVPIRRPHWMCKSTGRCRACPKEEQNRPYCQPYGNRAPIECRPVTFLPASKKPELKKPELKKPESKKPESKKPLDRRLDNYNNEAGWLNFGKRGDDIGSRNGGNHMDLIQESHFWPRQETVVSSEIFKGYQTCGRDQAQESWDFAEFVGFNLIFALVGLFILLQRQRLLAGQHQSMLARRIGRI